MATPKKTEARTLVEKRWGSSFIESIPIGWRVGLKTILRKTPGVENGTDPDPIVDPVVTSEVVTGRTNELERNTTELDAEISDATEHGQSFLERLGLIIGWTKHLSADGAEIGDADKDIEPLNPSVSEVKTYDLSALSSYSKIFAGMTSLEVPPSLEFLTPYFDGRDSSGQFTGTIGDCHWFDSGSWSYSLRGEGQGSAAIVAHVQHSVKQLWGRHVASKRVVFFMTPPVTIAQILTALTTFLGAAVTVMPSFKPTSITILLVSEAISLRAEAQEHVQDGGSGASAEEHSEYGGYGDSREHSKTIEAIVIPPCLHGVISISSTDTASADAAATAGANNSSPSTEIVTGRVLASGSASYPTAVPSSGLVVVALDPEPFYTKIMYHAEVVDMATV